MPAELAFAVFRVSFLWNDDSFLGQRSRHGSAVLFRKAFQLPPGLPFEGALEFCRLRLKFIYPVICFFVGKTKIR